MTFHGLSWIKYLNALPSGTDSAIKRNANRLKKEKKPVKAEQNRDLDSSRHLDEEKNIPIAALGEFLA